MRTLNPIFIIITFFICIVLYSCRTAKPDPCDCNLPKNLEKIIDDFVVKFDSANIIDSSKIVNIFHFKYNESDYILTSASSGSGKEYISSFCFYGDLLIIYTKLDEIKEDLFYSNCSNIPNYYRIYGITVNEIVDYDPHFKVKLYQIKDNRFKEIPFDSTIDDYLFELLIKKGIVPTPPPPPIE
ncbi:MAG: hypothetical protein ACRCX4_11360 [Bacteroidales bacterium]